MGLPAFDMSAFDAVQATAAAPPRVSSTIFMRTSDERSLSRAEHEQRIKKTTDHFVELTNAWRVELIAGVNTIEKTIKSQIDANDDIAPRMLLAKHQEFMLNIRNGSQILQEGDEKLIEATAEAVDTASVRLRDALPFLKRRQKIIVATAKLRADTYSRILSRLERFEKILQDRIAANLLPLVPLLPRAVETFGSEQKVWSWLLKPSPALANTAPIDLIRLDGDSVRVEELLGRIDHGLAA